jgi:membrane fusion protein, multidrug efflux system
MLKRTLTVVVGLFVTACLAGCSTNTSAAGPTGGGRGGRGGRGGSTGPAPVVTAKATQKDVPVDIDGIGNVEAYSTITVRAQVTGELSAVKFQEGDFVKKGQELFVIDPRPYQAQLDQAQANLTRDQALLEQSKAQLNRDMSNADYQTLTAQRQSDLNERGIVSKDQAQQSRAAADAAAAGVKADQAAVASAQAQLVAQQAAVENAKVALSYCVIVSPIDGRTGVLSVKAGNLVTANTTQLTTIEQVEPVYVSFAVPSGNLSAIRPHIGADPLSVSVDPQDDNGQQVTGRLSFLDNSIDPTTDTIKLKATFDNHDHRLWPGQFARVTLHLATIGGATVVPSEAVQTGQNGQFVFVVKDDSTVEQRPVTVGERVGEELVVQKGLEPGETVVTEGQLRLEPGSRVDLSDGQTPAGAPGSGQGRGGRNGRGGRGGRNGQSQQQTTH